MKDPEVVDREALEYASVRYDIPLSEPGAEEVLRKSLAFAGMRLNMAFREAAAELSAALGRSWLARRLHG